MRIMLSRSIMRRSASLLHVIVSASLLAACGGGGNGGSDGTVPVSSCSYVDLDTASHRSSLSGRLPSSVSQATGFTITSLPSKGTVTVTNPNTGDFVYESNVNARGTDSFMYRVTNSQGQSVTSLFNVVFIPRVMPLGDSITWGRTLPASNGDGHNPPIGQRVGYRKVLRDLLAGAGYRIDYVGTLQSGYDSGFLPDDPDHEGHGAWTTAHLADGFPGAPTGTGGGNLAEWLDATKPDVVLLHSGTNDLNNGADPTSVAQEVERLLNIIDSWESSNWPVTVVLARIINTNPATAATTAFNNALNNNVYSPRAARGDRIRLADHQGALNGGDYSDQLHPNDSGYQKMANVWRSAMQNVLPRCD
jgi:hypothetical protein